MSRRCRIHIVLELPVVPTQQVFVCRLGDTSDLGPTLRRIHNTTKLSYYASDPQAMDIVLPSLDIQLIVEVAFFASQFACKRAVCMIVEHILVGVIAEGLVKAAYHVLRRWLEEQQFVLLDSPDLGADFPVEREKDTVVVLIRSDERVRIAPEITTSWLVYDVVAYHVRLALKEVYYLEPHLNEFVIHASLVGEEVMSETSHIVGYVVLEERHFHAVLLQRQTLGVSPQGHLEGRWKARGFSEPSRKALSAKFLTIKIVMGIDDNSNPIVFCFSYNIFEHLKIGIVVLMPFGFKPFPGDIQANRIKSPFLQVDEIFFYQ